MTHQVNGFQPMAVFLLWRAGNAIAAVCQVLSPDIGQCSVGTLAWTSTRWSCGSLTLSCSASYAQDTKRDARSVLSRTGLLSELQSKGILNLVPPEVKQIHALLEADFNPLELCRKLVRCWGVGGAVSGVC